ncbi:MAG: indolepyruvate ferredoxin oxidoreductase family protein, partial [Pseudomonas sp.]
RLAPIYSSSQIESRLDFLAAKEKALAAPKHHTVRTPHFCSGCPHNTSTKLPEGSRAQGGIGCHYMTQWMDRNTDTFTQMGGEGATWIGQAPFTDTPHIFQNLGDGTYFHSGQLALRAAVASGVNITYKILYNDAVAMTGGQPIDGELRVDQLSQQVFAEGVKRIALVTDEPEKYPTRDTFAPIVSFHHRRELDAVQRELREFKGTSVIIYDQTCATEKRRRRKRGKLIDPAKRAFINPAVCEGCGDCSVKSNCLSVLPLETELGRKRQIDQNSCNKDFSCVDGFCPSFVTVHGGSLRQPEAVGAGAVFAALPEPTQPTLERPWNILLPGVGGSGVTTVGALLGMAAHIEGKGCSVLDQAGLAQKFGPVITHIRVAAKQADIYAVRIAAGETDLLLGCDLVVAASEEALAKLNDRIATAVVNSHEAATAEFTRNPDAQVPGQAMQEALIEAVGEDKTHFIDATHLATRLLGDSIATNLFMLGYAYQRGLVPVSAEAIEQAISLNGVAVKLNCEAFLWGRRAAHDLPAVEKLATPAEQGAPSCETLDEVIQFRIDYLTAYQDAGYAKRYSALVERVRSVDSDASKQLTEAVARYYFKVLAYKDEYEVARLYSNGDFRKQLEAQFSGDYRLEFHLAPSWLAKRDPLTGEPRKRQFGPWMLRAFGLLAKFKFLRGSALDPFAYSEERRQERELIGHYEASIAALLTHLRADNYRTAVAIAELPEQIRGYGHVKERALAKAREHEAQLRGQLLASEINVVRLFESAA